MSQKNRVPGFTLVEILVSLFILSLIGVIIASGLDVAVKAQLKFEKKYHLLAEVQLALTIMERDLQQVTDRPILNEKHEIEPAFQIAEKRLELTRSGYINPFAMNKRSTLQRVAYHLEGSTLIRSSWFALDRDLSSKADDKILLHGVKDFSIQVVDSPAPLGPSPTDSNPAGQAGLTNKGVIIEMMIEELGYVKRIFSLPGNNVEISHVEAP